jgi:hypothetical protein
LIAILTGVTAMFIAVVLVLGWNAGDVHWAGAAVLSPLAFILGVVSPLIGVGMILEIFLGYCRRERLTLGDAALQCVIRAGEVLDHLPYDNIQDMEVQHRQEETGPPYKIVGLKLVDPQRPDTVLRLTSRLSPADEDDEFDVTIQDLYKLSPEKLHKKLKARWKKSRTEDLPPILPSDTELW